MKSGSLRQQDCIRNLTHKEKWKVQHAISQSTLGRQSRSETSSNYGPAQAHFVGTRQPGTSPTPVSADCVENKTRLHDISLINDPYRRNCDSQHRSNSTACKIHMEKYSVTYYFLTTALRNVWTVLIQKTTKRLTKSERLLSVNSCNFSLMSKRDELSDEPMYAACKPSAHLKQMFVTFENSYTDPDENRKTRR